LRLQKYLAQCGVASRRASEVLIEAGRVTVNGEPATLGMAVAPWRDDVQVDGHAVRPASQSIYLLLNKPRFTVTTAQDTHGRDTVFSHLQDVPQRVFAVGRLDYDVDGALLFTNDGELANRLAHPRYEVAKVYRVLVEGRLTDEAKAELETGVPLEDGITSPARVAILARKRLTTLIALTLHEGRKREVKRMCAAVGHPVKRLTRQSFAGITAEGLEPGQWRYLRDDEVAALRERTGLAG
jgi:23S rRNA pseudouridine2605 synthase